MADLLLPGSIPGLLARGAPVVWTPIRTDGESIPGANGVVVGFETVDGEAWCDVAWTGRRYHHEDLRDFRAHVAGQPCDAVSLDLSSEAGVDRAIRWAAPRVGVRGSAAWLRLRDGVWALSGEDACPSFCSIALPLVGGSRVIPSLSVINLGSPTANVEALIAVVLRLAGVTS